MILKDGPGERGLLPWTREGDVVDGMGDIFLVGMKFAKPLLLAFSHMAAGAVGFMVGKAIQAWRY